MRQLAALLPLLLAACAGVPGIAEPPEVTVAGIGLGRVSLDEQEVELDLKVTNPNVFPLFADGLRFAFELEGTELAQGATVAGFNVPAGDTAVVPVTIALPMRELLAQARGFSFRDGVDYRIVGDVLLDNPILPSVPFRYDGELTLVDLPRLGS